jgi:hypothetical protein
VTSSPKIFFDIAEGKFSFLLNLLQADKGQQTLPTMEIVSSISFP